MTASPLNGLFARLRGLASRRNVAAAPAAQDVLPPPTPEVADCVCAFDDGLRSAAKAWSSGALLPKVNPRRVERVLEALASRETLRISALVVEIAAPDNSVSPVSTITATNNVMREQFVRGVMGAVMAAIVDVEKAHQPGTIQAGALLDRLRNWIERPLHRQQPDPGSDEKGLAEANDILCRIASDILEGSDEQAAAMVRLGMVGPLGVALQITKMLQETPPSVLGLQVAGFEFAGRPEAAEAAAGDVRAAEPAVSGSKS